MDERIWEKGDYLKLDTPGKRPRLLLLLNRLSTHRAWMNTFIASEGANGEMHAFTAYDLHLSHSRTTAGRKERHLLPEPRILTVA